MHEIQLMYGLREPEDHRSVALCIGEAGYVPFLTRILAERVAIEGPNDSLQITSHLISFLMTIALVCFVSAARQCRTSHSKLHPVR